MTKHNSGGPTASVGHGGRVEYVTVTSSVRLNAPGAGRVGVASVPSHI